MTGVRTPSALPPAPVPVRVVAPGRDWRASFRAMASAVSVTLGPGCADPDEQFERVERLFAAVEAQCTRFDPGSDLMRANGRGTEWTPVGAFCFAALGEAYRMHTGTGGAFDPRVLQALQRLGYATSMADGHRPDLAAAPPPAGPPVRPWAPDLDPARQAVRIGPDPVDLGGIGKGLAVRWAAAQLVGPSLLIEAGGDCYARGPAPDGGPWRIGVEDPAGGDRPVAVLAVRDVGCVTSSIRSRRWRAGGRTVHHLIDPRTGAPGGAGLAAVTVVGADPAESEVWSKVLFLHGAAGIAAAADRGELAVLWVDRDGATGMNAAMRPLVVWQDRS